MKQNGDFSEISFREIEPEKIRQPKPWNQMKSELEEQIAKMGFKNPVLYITSADGVYCIMGEISRNGGRESYHVIDRNYENGAERVKKIIQSTRIVSY